MGRTRQAQQSARARFPFPTPPAGWWLLPYPRPALYKPPPPLSIARSIRKHTPFPPQPHSLDHTRANLAVGPEAFLLETKLERETNEAGEGRCWRCGGGGGSRPSLWRTPTPYLFLGFAFMMGLIAVALLVLICTRRKPSSSSSSRSREEEAASVRGALAPLDREPRVVVIMAGDDLPSFLASAKPLAFAFAADSATRAAEAAAEGGAAAAAV